MALALRYIRNNRASRFAEMRADDHHDRDRELYPRMHAVSPPSNYRW